MKFQKKYTAIALVVIVVIINIVATLGLLFAMVYPDRLLREVVNDYFKNNINKAVKYEELYIDATGDLIISDFNMSITSDFNDNISLVKSSEAVVDLSFMKLITGNIKINGIDFYKSEVTFIKKYGKSHLECFQQVLDPDKFISKTLKTYGEFYIAFHGAKMFYRESFRDRQITMELDKIDAKLAINDKAFTYSATGRIKPYKSTIIRKGDFSCSGRVNIKDAGFFSHRVKIDNFDLTYLNEQILENKYADVLLNGGASVDADINGAGETLSIKGRAETNTLSIASITKKYNLLSNENLNLDIDMIMKPALNSCTVRAFKLYDDVLSIEGSGGYARNDKEDFVKFQFTTNNIDLGDLSQNLTPLQGIEYSGSLRGDGSMSLDFKKKKASGMKLQVVLDEFTVSKNAKGGAVQLVDSSNMNLKISEKSMDVVIRGKPLGSDLEIRSKSVIDSWIPFKSDTGITARSKKMNLENLEAATVFIVNGMFASAYDDKRGGLEKIPFLQGPLGNFMNNNVIALKVSFDRLFYGKKAALKDFVLNAQLNRGAVSIGEFKVDGYEAEYRLGCQAYFNSDQPYVKIEGKIDDFDLTGFYADSGLSGHLSGKARCDFSYEVSVARIGDILDNGKGHLNVYVGKGEMRSTRLQQAIIKFLKKNGYEGSTLSSINVDDITISISEQGENFWFSNFGLRGDTLLFSAVGDYLYEGGITTIFNATVRKDTAVITVPLRLSGPVLAPCLDIVNKKDSQKLCY
jgi:hypothetical protein